MPFVTSIPIEPSNRRERRRRHRQALCTCSLRESRSSPSPSPSTSSSPSLLSDVHVFFELYAHLLRTATRPLRWAISEAIELAGVPLAAILPEPARPTLPATSLADPDSIFIASPYLHARVHVRVHRSEATSISANSKFDALLQHGMLGSSFSYRHITPRLASLLGGSVVSIDRPPFGLTETPLSPIDGAGRSVYSINGGARIAQDAARRLGLKRERCVLIGHSLGGAVALADALDESKGAPAGLILLAPALEIRAAEGRPREMLGALLGLPGGLGRRVVRERFWKMARSEKVVARMGFREDMEEVLEGYSRPLRKERWDEGLLWFIRDFEGYSMINDREMDLRSFDTPVLVIAGENDAVVPRATLDKLCGMIRNSTLVVMNGVGHMPLETHPDQLMDIIEEWITRTLQ